MAALSLLVCLVSLLLFPQTLALQVAPNSPCASACIDKEGTDLSDPNTSSTKPSDITCKDRGYGSAVGQKWQKCMSCLQNSTFSQGSESDQQWFTYNLRYSVNSCIFNLFNQSGISVGVCATSRACGSLEQALKYDNMDASKTTHYGYCDADGGAMTGSLFGQCLSCVKTGGETIFLANAIIALEAGCLQRPARGGILGLNGSVFSKSAIGIVDPATITQPAQKTGSSGPPTVVIAVAVVAGVLALIIAAAVGFICYRKRRNRLARSSPVTGSNGGIFSHHRPTSSLSFRCQAHLDPLSPRFQPTEPDIAEVEAQRPGITNTRRTSTNPWGPDSVRAAADNASIATSQRSGFTGTIAPVYLNPLTTQLPKAPPAVHQSPSGIRKSPKTPDSGFGTPSSATNLLPPASHMPYVPQQYGIAMQLTGTEQPNGHYTTGAASANPSSPVSNKRLQDIWADAMAVSASPNSTKAHNDIWADALANQRPNRNAGAGGLYRAPSNNSTSTGWVEPVSAVSLLRNNDRWAEALAAQQAASYSSSKKAQDVYPDGVYRPGDVPPPKSPNEPARKKKSRESSGSPVETRHVQVQFPPPPPRR